ncbi:MAG: hypothetical protein IT160_13880 [Bryobacterales bacterium]|nr:hypothetical protein [Bryobacterales bacterium]
MEPSTCRPWRRREAALWFLVLLLITATYQVLYCHTTTNGDPSGLFFTGSALHRPAGFNAFLYSGYGYDGQMYRLLAHDPLDRKGYWKFLDDPRFRSRRALVSLTAAVLGGGSPPGVDLWFIAIADILLALGGVCFVRLAEDYCPRPAALLLYLLIPAVVASTDRMVLDGQLVAAALAAWLFYRDRLNGPLMGVLVAAPLIRETGVCITAGVVLAYFAAREYRRAAAAAATLAPALAWWSFVMLRTPPSPATRLLSVPLVPQILRLVTPFARPVEPAAALLFGALDVVACLCLLVALAWFAWLLVDGLRRRSIEEGVLLVLPFAALTAFASSRPIMEDPYGFMRVNSPLLAWAALRMMRSRAMYAALYLPALSAALLIYRARPLWRLLGS